MSAAAADGWMCQCRRCHGVRTDDDALQYAYEFFIGEEEQHEIVVAFQALSSDGRSSLTSPFLDGEPDVLNLVGERAWVFSFRPGKSAVPTEGDIPRWQRWRALEPGLRDWFLIEGDRWSSVASVSDALRARRPVPRPQIFSNYWWREPTS